MKKRIRKEQISAMEQFNVDQEIKFMQLLKQRFYYNSEIKNREDETNIKDKIILFDKFCILGIIGKSEEMKKILVKFTHKDDKDSNYGYSFNVPKMGRNFGQKESDEAKSNYSIDYLDFALKLYNIIDDKVTISMAKDYPMTLHGKHFDVIIAPRVECD